MCRDDDVRWLVENDLDLAEVGGSQHRLMLLRWESGVIDGCPALREDRYEVPDVVAAQL